MKTIEKIANAQKRIDELKRLIKYWNDSEKDNAKIVDFSTKVAQIESFGLFNLIYFE